MEMLVGMLERIYPKVMFGCDVELLISGAQKVMLHPYSGMTP